MVKKRHDADRRIPEISFAAPAGTPAGVEVLSLADLRHRVSGERLTTPRRPDFHHLVTLTGGTLRHAVDFTAYALEPGSWLWVRPGQVQQWGWADSQEHEHKNHWKTATYRALSLSTWFCSGGFIPTS